MAHPQDNGEAEGLGGVADVAGAPGRGAGATGMMKGLSMGPRPGTVCATACSDGTSGVSAGACASCP